MTCPSPNTSPCQRKCDSRSIGALVTRDPTMNLQPAVVEAARFAAESMPGVGDDDQVLDAVPGPELADDRQDGVLLGLVPLEAADLEREALPVDQQADHDLRIDPAFLGVADLAQPVLVLGLEVQRRDVVEHEARCRRRPARG